MSSQEREEEKSEEYSVPLLKLIPGKLNLQAEKQRNPRRVFLCDVMERQL